MFMRRMTTIIAVSLQRELTRKRAVSHPYWRATRILPPYGCAFPACKTGATPSATFAGYPSHAEAVLDGLPIQNWLQVPPSHTVPALNLAGDCQHRPWQQSRLNPHCSCLPLTQRESTAFNRSNHSLDHISLLVVFVRESSSHSTFWKHCSRGND